MTWITTIGEDDADGKLKLLYGRVRGPGGKVDNVLVSHSLRPHGLEGHLALYRAVLHHSGNRLPAAYLEAIGTYVSRINGCGYCFDHHFAGMARLIGDDARAEAIRQAFAADAPERAFGGAELAGLQYAKALTTVPAGITERHIDDLRSAGYDDGEILEINQVAAYFAYANRTVLGLGTSTKCEELGLSPNSVG